MPWETNGSSKRRLELPPNWYTEIRPRILKRDGYVCQQRRSDRPGICGQPANQVDHINDPHDHSDDNLQSLCAWHHRKKTEGESAEARRRIAAKGKMPVRKHPGLL